jgi:glycosyltransferase involved in cell wall biosynthesis
VSERNLDPEILPFRKRMLLDLYRFVDRVVANSSSQVQRLQNLPHLKNKTECIVNTVDTDHFRPDPTASNRSFGPLRGIIIARYAPSKNVFLPINWAVEHAGSAVTFNWYGNTFLDEDPSASNLYNKALGKIKSLGVNTVFLHGPTADIERLYHQHDFLCLPSFFEGTPNVICEAMASGLPILCSAVADNPLIVDEGLNGFLFNPHSLDSFNKALRRLLALTADERARMGERNRLKAVEIFSEHRFVDRWEKLIAP